MATLWFMQHDVRVKNYIGAQYRNVFQHSLNCTFEGSVESVNFISPSITFAHVRVTDPHNPSWSWSAKRYTTSCSWWHLFLYRKADLRVTLDTFNAVSQMSQNGLAIGSHMQKIFMGVDAGVPLELKSVVFKKASCVLHDEYDRRVHLAWHSESKKMQGRLKTTGYFVDGSVKGCGGHLFDSLKGSVYADINPSCDEQTKIDIDCAVDASYLPVGMQRTTFSGTWSGKRGIFSLKNTHEHIMIDPIHMFYDGYCVRCSIRGTAPLESLWRFTTCDATRDEVTGLCSLVCDMRYEDNDCAVTGRVSFDNCAYKQQSLGSGVITYARQAGEWKGSLRAHEDTWYNIKGGWHWSEDTHAGILKISNNDVIRVPGVDLCIQPGNLHGSFQLNEQNHITGSYRADITTPWHDELVVCSGTLRSDAEHIVSTGTIQRYPYECSVQLQPVVQLDSFICNDPSGITCIRAGSNNNTVTHLVCGLSFIRTLMEYMQLSSIQADGSLAADITMQPYGIDVSIQMVDALMRLPQTYNVVHDGKLNVQIDTRNRRVVIRDGECRFHEGRCAINRAVLYYDDAYMPTFMHIPLIADVITLNMEHGLLATLSGYALISKPIGKPAHIEATVIIDRAHISENLLSGTFQKNLFRYTGKPFRSYRADTTCDIHIVSKNPVRVKTSFLQAAARVNVNVANTILDPQLTGSIDLLSGLLAFPYRPLYITKGSIYFLPHQLHDPSIELFAKNKIKKYNVELQVTGSLQHHAMILDATPSLTEEQIIALLLVGSQEESLNIVMPALIMQNLQSVMFGYDQSPRAIDKLFANLLQPFDHIHVVPRFSDQTGRGGLRGAIEIDVNDRWRALIQKNFSLTEDVLLEVEYLISDEMSIRGLKNERRDIGAEVEMRWKF